PAGPDGRAPRPPLPPPPGRPPCARRAPRAPLHARRRGRCPAPSRDRFPRRWQPGRRAARGCPPARIRSLAIPACPRGPRWARLRRVRGALPGGAGRLLVPVEKASDQLVEGHELVGASRLGQGGGEAGSAILATRDQDRDGGWVAGAQLGRDPARVAYGEIE